MKKFIMEFFSRILLGILVAAFVFWYCKSKISLSGALGILTLFLILWGYYCRSILLLIFDILKGSKTEIVYFSQMRTVRRCQIFFLAVLYCLAVLQKKGQSIWKRRPIQSR